jgi:hypothetical protein
MVEDRLCSGLWEVRGELHALRNKRYNAFRDAYYDKRLHRFTGHSNNTNYGHYEGEVWALEEAVKLIDALLAKHSCTPSISPSGA